MKLKVVNMVSIDGTYVNYDTLPMEQKIRIGKEINERALNSLGFVRVKEEEEATESDSVQKKKEGNRKTK